MTLKKSLLLGTALALSLALATATATAEARRGGSAPSTSA